VLMLGNLFISVCGNRPRTTTGKRAYGIGRARRASARGTCAARKSSHLVSPRLAAKACDAGA